MKRSAAVKKELLRRAKVQMAEEGNATVIDSDLGKYHTIFTRNRNKTGDSLRDEGLTKKQAVSKARRELIRQERQKKYQQILAGTYESGLKFEHTSEEQYGNMLQLNDSVPEYWLTLNNVPAQSVMLLINSSSYDVGHEGRMVQVLAPNGSILDVRAGWLNAVDQKKI